MWPWVDGRWRASSATPWLSAPGLERWRGRWLTLRYHAGLFDDHVRPLIRFRNAAGDDALVPMNGALAGVGEWTGRVPADAATVSISPIRRPGPFSFALITARPIPRAVLLVRGMLANPRLTVVAIGARAIGARAEARHCLSFAALATPMRRYADWLAERSRPIDLTGFDRPHAEGQQSFFVHLFGDASGDRAALGADTRLADGASPSLVGG